MKKNGDILKEIRQSGEQLEIPGALKPERMRETVEERLKEEHVKKQLLKGKRGRHSVRRGGVYGFAAAACLCLVAGAGLLLYKQGLLTQGGQEISYVKIAEKQELLEVPHPTYEEIYERLSRTWESRTAVEEELRMGAASTEEEKEYAAVDSAPDAQGTAFGRTNVQEEGVDEADCIKNDGRYLYQIAWRPDTGAAGGSWGIQIADTKEGLRETAFLDGFSGIAEFYVWEDLLLVIENKQVERQPELLYGTGKTEACYDLLYEAGYHEISVYDIGDRSRPAKVKTFTLDGNYETSRIADGYFYGVSRFYPQQGDGAEDYDAYIPKVDGQLLPARRIYYPEGNEDDSCLVLVSIDLTHPKTLCDSRAVLGGSDLYYMSRENLYIADYRSVYRLTEEDGEEGRKQEALPPTVTDETRLLKFSYKDGKFYSQAEGAVPGRLENSFSMDESRGYLRLVTTVEEYTPKRITDDRTGKEIFVDYGTPEQTNALYILSPTLDVSGKIEGLAEGERVYAARFLGDMGYFVTFRQTDPLFAVDLSNPSAPRVIGEKKVSGFSEYLHFYGENLLLGIGKEADEQTGEEQGLKLSMFDLSDPADIQETARLHLEDYQYSDALWDHRAVLVDTRENLIGFPGEGSDRGGYCRDYLVFSYEDGAFVQKLKLNVENEDGGFYRTRGTFIGDTLYLLSEDGRIRAYDRESGELQAEI